MVAGAFLIDAKAVRRVVVLIPLASWEHHTMTRPPDHQEELQARTRSAAVALIEDLQHIRGLLDEDNPSPGEFRRLSVTLRRILLQRDLAIVAAPRIGRIKLIAPDNKPAVRSSTEKNPIPFFGSAGVKAFGIEFRAHLIDKGAKPRTFREFDPDRTVELRVDNFIAQPVLCLHGEWFTRANVIEYVANVASGAHSGSPATAPARKREMFSKIARIRQAVTIWIEDGTCKISANLDVVGNKVIPFKYAPDAIDVTGLEIMAAARFLVESPDTKTLEAAISEELKAHS